MYVCIFLTKYNDLCTYLSIIVNIPSRFGICRGVHIVSNVRSCLCLSTTVGFYLSSSDDATVLDNICLYWSYPLQTLWSPSFLVVPRLSRVYGGVSIHLHIIVYSMDNLFALLTSWAPNSDMDLRRHSFLARHSIFRRASTWPCLHINIRALSIRHCVGTCCVVARRGR